MSGSGALINKEVLISLVVCTLGRTTPLERLFESLLTQEHKNFEVIVVDQNRDNRLDPLFEDKRWPFPLRRLRTPGELGASRGRNTGWPIAEGSVIVFPDDDCWYPPWFLARGLSLMAATGADFLSGRAADEDGCSINGRYELTAQPINRSNVWTAGIEWIIFFKKEAIPRSASGLQHHGNLAKGRTLCSARWRIVRKAITIHRFMDIMQHSILKRKPVFREKAGSMGGGLVASCVSTGPGLGPP
jgi:glycosyltransferase involved in cell wall biosynthesis